MGYKFVPTLWVLCDLVDSAKHSLDKCLPWSCEMNETRLVLGGCMYIHINLCIYLYLYIKICIYEYVWSRVCTHAAAYTCVGCTHSFRHQPWQHVEAAPHAAAPWRSWALWRHPRNPAPNPCCHHSRAHGPEGWGAPLWIPWPIEVPCGDCSLGV